MDRVNRTYQLTEGIDQVQEQAVVATMSQGSGSGAGESEDKDVPCFCQDRAGIMWAVTPIGLHRVAWWPEQSVVPVIMSAI